MPQSLKEQMNPSDLPAMTGYVMFSRLYNGGRHGLQSELPQGNVIGSRSGYEHCEHWNNLTNPLASW
jgi:hypothetical protein